jgi:hypothetical protein
VHRNLGKREESMQTMRKPDTKQTKFATQPQKKLFGKCKKFELKTQKKKSKTQRLRVLGAAAAREWLYVAKGETVGCAKRAGAGVKSIFP